MENLLELIKSRRSVRKFSGQQIDRKHLELCVEAARYAPSACNAQPWKLIIVNDPQEVKSIADRVFSGHYSMNTFARESAALIAIVSERQKLAPRLGGIVRRTDFRLIDIGIACEHLVLQATELGIGTCLLGWFNEKELKRSLSIPSSKKIYLVIALGYPAETEYKERKLKDTLDIVDFK